MSKEYDKYQKEVINIEGGYHLVLAPPGCGKTDILAERIFQAHNRGVDYGDMMCLTFTNRASKGMKERIEQQSQNPVPSELFVGNLHRYCSQFLFSNKVVNQNAPILDEFDTLSILIDIITFIPNEEEDFDDDMTRIDNLDWEQLEYVNERAKIQHLCRQITAGHPKEIWLYPEGYEKLKTISSSIIGEEATPDTINTVIETIVKLMANIDNGESLPSLDELPEFIQERVDLGDLKLVVPVYYGNDEEECYRLLCESLKYGIYKRENDMLDFDDLLIETYEELHNNTQKYHKYKWIQIDEVQDLNRLQFAISDLLTDETHTVVYLGDEQQAIFSFMGAKLETLEWLKVRCEGNMHFLHKNYRSPKYLLDVYNKYATDILKISPDLLPSTDNVVPHQREDLYCAYLQDNMSDSKKITQLAVNYNKLGGGTVAVLVPTNKEADAISDSFKELKVEHFKVSGKDVFTTKELRVIIAHLNIIQNEVGFTQWAKLLYHLGIVSGYSVARDFMRKMKEVALLPNDLFLKGKSSYLQDFLHVYQDKEIVLFDTETTGLDVFNDDIIQIAAIKIRNGQKVSGSDKVIYMESDKGLPPIIANETNPMIEAMAKAREDGLVVSRQEGLSNFIEYCKGTVLVAHNIKYDYNILKYNIQKELPTIKLELVCPEYYDTLKLIRLLEPRQKVYKLVRLLEVLHLEGVNSHNAIDDVNATKNLLDYCFQKGVAVADKQKAFLSRESVHLIATKLSAEYEALYTEGCSRLYNQEDNNNGVPLVVNEMQIAYDYFINEGVINPIDKWEHIKHYFSQDLIDSNLHKSLTGQLNAYLTDINTTKEADLCAGKSMIEKFFISTVHKAKGLEFDNVIVASCVLDIYPNFSRFGKKLLGGRLVTDYSKIIDPIGYMEDARLLYVAMSRAKRRLCLVWYGMKWVYSKRWKKWYIFPAIISPFIKPISDYFEGRTK